MPLELNRQSVYSAPVSRRHWRFGVFFALACSASQVWAQSASFSQAADNGQQSDPSFDSQPARETPKKSQTLTLAQAIKHVRHATPGKILSARRIQTSQGPAYRIKVLTRTGLVRVVQVAESVAPKPEPKGE